MYYFAYGPNMNLADFGNWCELRKVRHLRIFTKQPAILRDFKLVFDHYSSDFQCGIANLRPTPGEMVEGVIFNISDEDLWIIKKKNGVPGIYEEHVDPVTVYQYDETPVRPIKFFTIPEERCKPDLKPSKAYLQIIIDGAKAEKLHPEYIAKLQSIPTQD